MAKPPIRHATRKDNEVFAYAIYHAPFAAIVKAFRPPAMSIQSFCDDNVPTSSGMEHHLRFHIVCMGLAKENPLIFYKRS